MKKTYAPVILALLISPQVALSQQAAEPMPVPESFEARASYSIGVNMGRSLAAQAAPAFALDRDYLFRGIADALASASTLLDAADRLRSGALFAAVISVPGERYAVWVDADRGAILAFIDQPDVYLAGL